MSPMRRCEVQSLSPPSPRGDQLLDSSRARQAVTVHLAALPRFPVRISDTVLRKHRESTPTLS